jgi:hypothetical protein
LRGVLAPWVWISLDSLVRNQGFQWLARLEATEKSSPGLE